MRSSIKVRRTINGAMSRIGAMAIQAPSERGVCQAQGKQRALAQLAQSLGSDLGKSMP
jgi:hypothetical protein